MYAPLLSIPRRASSAISTKVNRIRSNSKGNYNIFIYAHLAMHSLWSSGEHITTIAGDGQSAWHDTIVDGPLSLLLLLLEPTDVASSSWCDTSTTLEFWQGDNCCNLAWTRLIWVMSKFGIMPHMLVMNTCRALLDSTNSLTVLIPHSSLQASLLYSPTQRHLAYTAIDRNQLLPARIGI